jgi:hypothetical protein
MFVYVRNQDGAALMPCTPAKARKLLQTGKAQIIAHRPFTIQLTWQCEGHVQEVRAGIDKGSSTSRAAGTGCRSPWPNGAGRYHWSYPYSIERIRHPRSLGSQISEFIDDPEAWTTVLSTMRQHLPGLTGNTDIATFMLHNSTMTLRQVLSLLSHAAEVRTALEAGLAALGR